MRFYRIWCAQSYWSSNKAIYIKAESETDAYLEAYESYPYDLVEDCEEISESEYETECVS